MKDPVIVTSFLFCLLLEKFIFFALFLYKPPFFARGYFTRVGCVKRPRVPIARSLPVDCEHAYMVCRFLYQTSEHTAPFLYRRCAVSPAVFWLHLHLCSVRSYWSSSWIVDGLLPTDVVLATLVIDNVVKWRCKRNSWFYHSEKNTKSIIRLKMVEIALKLRKSYFPEGFPVCSDFPVLLRKLVWTGVQIYPSSDLSVSVRERFASD